MLNARDALDELLADRFDAPIRYAEQVTNEILAAGWTPPGEPRTAPTVDEIARALYALDSPSGNYDLAMQFTRDIHLEKARTIAALYASQPTVREAKAEAWDKVAETLNPDTHWPAVVRDLNPYKEVPDE